MQTKNERRAILRSSEISCKLIREAQLLVGKGMYDSAIARLNVVVREVGPQNRWTDQSLRHLRRIERDTSTESRLLPRLLNSLAEAAEVMRP
jgi:hypothetical protein